MEPLGTFGDVIEQSRTVPEKTESSNLDMPSMFPKSENPYVKGPQAGGGVELNYRSYTKVFVLWRPYVTCERCRHDIQTGTVVIPSVGEYTCPHTHIVEYKEVVDKILSGKGLIDTREFFNLPEGARCVHVGWFEPDAKVAAQIKKAQEHKAKNQVYPPDIGRAFKDPLEAKKDAIG